MSRKQRIAFLSKALKSDANWLEISLVNADTCEDLVYSDNETIAEQLVKMGFTTYYKGKYRRSRAETIVKMLEQA